MPHGRNEKGVCCHRLGQREGSFFLNVLFPRSCCSDSVLHPCHVRLPIGGRSPGSQSLGYSEHCPFDWFYHDRSPPFTAVVDSATYNELVRLARPEYTRQAGLVKWIYVKTYDFCQYWRCYGEKPTAGSIHFEPHDGSRGVMFAMSREEKRLRERQFYKNLAGKFLIEKSLPL